MRRSKGSEERPGSSHHDWNAWLPRVAARAAKNFGEVASTARRALRRSQPLMPPSVSGGALGTAGCDGEEGTSRAGRQDAFLFAEFAHAVQHGSWIVALAVTKLAQTLEGDARNRAETARAR